MSKLSHQVGYAAELPVESKQKIFSKLMTLEQRDLLTHLVSISVCTVYYYISTTLRIMCVHTFSMLFSSPSTFSMSNSLTFFVSMIYKRDSNLKSVRARILVILCVCSVHFFTTQQYYMYTHFTCYFPYRVHLACQIHSRTLFQ